MASTGVKEYTIRINGVEAGIKEVTKLEDAVKALDAATVKSNVSTTTAAKASSTRGKAITDEEKAAAKLAATQAKIKDADSAANKAQILATQQLRERTREITRQIAAENLAQGSIKQMGMQLTDLRNAYGELSAAERADEKQGGALLTQIQALDAEYKALKESTGDFRDSVGNYARAFEGLDKLKLGLNDVREASVGLATDVLGSQRAMALFGSTSGDVSDEMRTLQNTLTLVVATQEIYKAVTEEGAIADGVAAAAQGVRVIQTRALTAAQALQTRGTVLATIAQAAFNLVAAANPYVLLALAVVAVGAALFAFAQHSDSATESQKQLNDAENAFLEALDREAQKIKETSDARVTALERQLRILDAQSGKQKDLRALEDQIANERANNNAKLRKFYAAELADIDKNRQAMEDYGRILDRLNAAKALGASTLTLDVDLNGKLEEVDIDKAIESVQGRIDVLGKKVKIGVDLTDEQAELAAQDKITAAQRLKADKDLAAQRKKAATDAAKERADAELEAQRMAQDAEIKLIQDGYERSRAETTTNYNRQIQDLKKRLETEKKLTKKARQDINDTIVSLVQQQSLELDALAQARAAKELETARQLEDSQTALIEGQAARRQVEINHQYDRQIEDLKKRQETETDLTDEQQKAITQMILDAEEQRARALRGVTADELKKTADLQVQAAEDALKAVDDRVGQIMARGKSGLQLIDVDKTKDNLKTVNSALDTYVQNLRTYQEELTAAHDAQVADLQEGSTEYIAANQAYAKSMEDTTARIKAALQEQETNAKVSRTVQIEYFKDLFDKISEIAGGITQGVTSVLDTWNQGLQAQVDDMNTELDAVNEKYEAAKDQREAAAENVESLEERLQAATGGTADALRSQLADSMHARQESEREEQRLAKEKEKREADIAKKEKQMKRNELLGNIAQGIANTAQAVTQALTLIWPLNLVIAGLVGAQGAFQVGIMTRQLAKLAKGGEIKGASHAQGGVDVEVEGGEYVVNKTSYASNTALVNLVNDSTGPVSLADVAGVLSSDVTPGVVNDVSRSNEDRVIAAIQAMDFHPVVSVVDIIDVQDQITTVQDLAGATS